MAALFTSNDAGCTLAERLNSGGAISVDTAMTLVQTLAEAVQQIHASGHVHLAVLPEFVLITDGGEIQLGTIDSTRMLGAKRADRDWLPSALASVLPLEIPTELAAAAQVLKAADLDLDPRTIDIYQLGGLLCRLVTGESPQAYRRSPRVKGACPSALRPILEQALGCDGSTRFTRAEELCESLRGLSEPAALKPDTSPSVLLSGDRPEDTSVGASRSGASPSDTDSLPFARLGHYEVVGRIGHGGMGDVYRGYERALDRTVALKVLPAELSREPEFVRRFYAEASAAARVVHPHVIQIHFIGEDAGHHFFAMQYVDGESLASLLVRRGRLSVTETLDILEQTLSGLSAAHRQGLIHRDIKPGNILLDRVHQRAVLADFGLVKSLAAVEGHTATGVVLGTVDYIAPEQGRGQPVDHRCDLYAVGVLTYQLLSGRLPFEGDSPTAVIFQHVYERPPPLTDRTADVPPALAAVVAKLLAKSRESRHASAEAVLADLRAIRAGQSLPSQADVELAANPQAFMATSAQPVDPLAQTQIIRAPQFADEPWLPAELPLEPPTWRARVRLWLGDWLRLRTPAWVQQLQSTQQQIDGAVAEYERRRNQLQHLVREAEEVLATLRTALSENGDDADLRQAAADQEEQLGTMRLRLAQVEATLQQLRNQRDILHARLKAAHAKLHLAGSVQPGARWSRFSRGFSLRLGALVVMVVALCLVAVRDAARIQQAFESLTTGGRPRPPLPQKTNSAPTQQPSTPAVAQPSERQTAVASHADRFVTSLFDPSKSAFIGSNGESPMFEIKLWDLASGTEVLSLEKPHRTSRMAVSQKGEFLISAGRTAVGVGEIKIWDLKSGRLLHQITEGIPRHCPEVGFSPDGRTAYSLLGATLTQELGIIDVATGRLERMKFPQKNDQASGAAFSPTSDTAAIAVVGGRTAIDIHDLRQRRLKHSIQTEGTALQLAFSADGTLMAGAIGGMITLWRTEDWSQLAQLPVRVAAHERIAISPDGLYVAVLNRNEVYLADVTSRTVRQVGLAVRCLDLGFTSGGTLMIVPEHARVMFFDPATSKEQLMPKLRVRG